MTTRIMTPGVVLPGDVHQPMVLSYELTPWILCDALKVDYSGRARYRHGKGKFKIVEGMSVGPRHCCLGVACEVQRLPYQAMQTDFNTWHSDWTESAKDRFTGWSQDTVYLPEHHWLTAKAGGKNVQSILVGINDSYEGDTFDPVIKTLLLLIEMHVIQGNNGYDPLHIPQRETMGATS